MTYSTYCSHGRPRSRMGFASAGATAVFLLRGAAGFAGHAGTRCSTTTGGGTSAAATFTNQHGWQGSRLAGRAGFRSSTKRRRCARAGALFRCSGLPAAAVKGDGSAGSDEAGVAAAIALDDGDPVTSAAAAGRVGVIAEVGSEATGSINQQRDRDVFLADEGSADKAVEATGEAGGGVSSRNQGSLFVIMGLCFLVAVVCALDRVAMSVAIVPMGNVYDYSDTTKGLISSVFSWGYMASMVPSSVLIGVWGPKATITAGKRE
ncbi:unnamed protein product [Ectocarpus fasciculatus]